MHWETGRLGHEPFTQLTLVLTLPMTTVVGSVALQTGGGGGRVQLLVVAHVLAEVHVAVTTPR